MKRQRRTPGSIVKIDLKNGYYNYAQIVENGIAFFDIYTKDPELEDLSILLEKPVLFILEVYRDVISTGLWLKVGKLPIREDLKTLPMQCIQDALDETQFELYNPNTGEVTKATREECEGLETCAVWEAYHVESRLRDHYNGVPNDIVEALKIK
ncbi:MULTISPECIES: Imm26 family immunity protein [Bacteroides]|uniref:Imm26 family immunity protein n=1 Tax=Bacteroides TaxID=816 RepID=UPI002A7EBA1F|nr:Imm26 family immunity protein [Bacteroides nordii]